MNNREFGKVVADALEVGAQAHPVRIEEDTILRRTIIHALDKDQVLWRIEIRAPQ